VPPYQPAWQEAVAVGPVAQEAPERRSATRAVGRHLREIAETIILALVIFLVVRAVVQNFQVEGSSMEPTLESSWYLLVNKAAYWEVNVETLSKFVPFLDPGDDPTRYIFGGPGRGDVVVFIAPDQVPGQPERDFIKRIIGLPGETVEIKDCTVYVNGEALDEPYIKEQTNSTEPPVVVPPDHYFVLGDNRNNSRDSRAEEIGMIPKESIIGKAWLTYWPFDALGFVSDTSVEPGEGGDGQQQKTTTTQGVGACA
jgi:signal peptidase I